MKLLVIIFILCLVICGRCHELKGFTLKQFQFLYQIFTGDFMEIKKKEKIEKMTARNETSRYIGEYKFGIEVEGLECRRAKWKNLENSENFLL